MSRTTASKFAAVILMGATLSAASAMAHAQDTRKSQAKSKALATWFDAQRQLTDGKADPFVAASGDVRR